MASKIKSATVQSLSEMDMTVNQELISNIKMHPSLWYAVKYTQRDENQWDSISIEMGIQKSWLKRRWQQLRTEYNSDSLHNPVLVKHLSFLKKCAKRADKVDDSIQIDHQIVGGDEFNVTQEQLDECMNETICTDANTINFDADNESNGSFAEYEFTIVADGSNDVVPHQTKNVNKTITIEKVVEDGRNSSERTASANLKIESPSIASKESPNTEVNEVEYQDKVFGDLVSAMLAKMTPEKKKQAKKEIMNILL